MLTFFLGYICGALSIPLGLLLWWNFGDHAMGGAGFSESDFEELKQEQTATNVGHNSPQDK